jgi:hypothetical protein
VAIYGDPIEASEHSSHAAQPLVCSVPLRHLSCALCHCATSRLLCATAPPRVVAEEAVGRRSAGHATDGRWAV